ncbi:HVO_0476 family zinc finger protein [Methanolobus sp. ZRKC2]|uniref:HVO_0476 family zinc finger protein n=1 Tax=Methanolobus sp. ZRKC2 TaxID=3125783 RepID=UPI0032473D9C
MNEEVEVVCPSCSPKIEVPHDVLKSGQNIIVQCQECGNVHPTTIERPKNANVKVIISRGEDSFSCIHRMTSEDVVRVEDEMIIDDEVADEVYPIIVTAIDTDEKRVNAAKAPDISTIWGRAIDEVIVRISIHKGRNTQAVEKRVPGGYEFTIGNNDKADSIDFRVTKIKKRDGTFLSSRGTVVEAKDIKRVFADEAKRQGWGEGRTAWSMRGKGRSW